MYKKAVAILLIIVVLVTGIPMIAVAHDSEAVCCGNSVEGCNKKHTRMIFFDESSVTVLFLADNLKYVVPQQMFCCSNMSVQYGYSFSCVWVVASQRCIARMYRVRMCISCHSIWQRVLISSGANHSPCLFR